MECKFCNRKFKNKHTLKTHQSRTKYCLKLQGKDEEPGDYVCSFCGTSFNRKSILDKHLTTCKANSEYIQEKLEQIPKLEQELAIVKQQLQDALTREQQLRNDFINIAAMLAKKPTTTTNTVNHVSVESSKKIVDGIRNTIEEHGGIFE